MAVIAALNSKKLARSLVLLVIIGLLITIPILAVAQSSNGSVSIQSENGSPSGGVTFIDSTLASGGKFANFRSTGGQETYANIPSNFNVNSYLVSHPVGGDYDSYSEPSGAFRTFCRPSHLEYDDPIVYPGEDKAAHLHQFFGNTAVDENSTYQSLRTTGTSTCEGGPINRTGYWTPAMFDQSDRVVPPKFILVYYKSFGEGGDNTKDQDRAIIRAYESLPNGLRMLSSNFSWKCEVGSSSGKTIAKANCQPGDTLIGTVDFPMCWDGTNLDSADHKSHMAFGNYSNGFGRYECPSSHPHLLPHITEFFHYAIQSGDNLSQWRLSSDMGAAGGSTLHADWFGAWDNDIMERWMNGCLRGMKSCNNGDFADGQGLGESSGGMGTSRVSGYTPFYSN